MASSVDTGMNRWQWVPEGPLKIARQFTGGLGCGGDRECRRHDWVDDTALQSSL